MYCPDCGFQNRPGVNFCERCGSSLPGHLRQDAPAAQPEGIPCPACGFRNRGGVRFCEQCGDPLSIEAIRSLGPPPRRRNLLKFLGLIGGTLAVLCIVLVGTLFFMRRRATASTLPRHIAPNEDPPAPPSQLSGSDGLFEQETVNMLYDSPETGPLFTYQEGEYNYTYFDSTWIAMKPPEDSSPLGTLVRQVTNAPKTAYIFGTIEGAIVRDGGEYIFRSTGPISDWTRSQLDSLPGIVQRGGQWVLDIPGSPLDWAEGQEIQGGMLARDGSEIELINTAASSEVERTDRGFKFLLGLDSINPKAAIAITINPGFGSNYIITSVLEKLSSGDWSEGCGNRKWAWAIPDGDLSAIVSAGLFEIWESACLAHDECYGVCEKTQEMCDKEFKQDMVEACRDAYDPLGEYIPLDLDVALTGGLTTPLKLLREECEFLAEKYYGVVRDVGSDSYKMKPHIDTFSATFEPANAHLASGACTNLDFEVINSPDGGIKFSGQGMNSFSSRNPSGSFEVCPEQTSIFAMSAQDCAGEWRDFYATIHVQQDLAIELSADRYSLTTGECTTLRWQVTGYLGEIWIDGGYQPPGGSKVVCPQQTKSYSIEFEMMDGSRRGEAIVIQVAEPEPASAGDGGIATVSIPGCSPGWAPCGDGACPIGFCEELGGSFYCQWEPAGDDDPLWGGGCEAEEEVGIEVAPQVNPACEQDFSTASFWTAYLDNGELAASLVIPEGMRFAASQYSLFLVDAGRYYVCAPLPDVPRRLYCHGYPPEDISASEIALYPEGDDCEIPLPVAHMIIPEPPPEEETCGEEPAKYEQCADWKSWCACSGGSLGPDTCDGDECVCMDPSSPCCGLACILP